MISRSTVAITVYLCTKCSRKMHKVDSKISQAHRGFAHALPPGCRWPEER